MKKLLIGLLVIGSSSLFAATATDVSKKNWTCTTNASSSEVATEKAADDQMSNTQNTAAASFEFAAKNCRDCTKITCELHD